MCMYVLSSSLPSQMNSMPLIFITITCSRMCVCNNNIVIYAMAQAVNSRQAKVFVMHLSSSILVFLLQLILWYDPAAVIEQNMLL